MKDIDLRLKNCPQKEGVLACFISYRKLMVKQAFSLNLNELRPFSHNQLLQRFQCSW